MPTSGSGSASGVISSAYPTSTDLSTFLTSAGFTLTAGLTGQLVYAIDAAIADFERATRRTFLAGSSATRYYDPPTNRRRLLFLQEGGGPGELVGTITVVYQPTGSTASTLTANTDYRLLPRNAVTDGLPYDRIEFFNRYWSDPLGPSLTNSLQVTGQWGYSTTTIPDQVWYAMLARGAWIMFANLAQSVTGGLANWKENDISEQYGDWGKNLAGQWDAQYQAAVAHYRRIVLM